MPGIYIMAAITVAVSAAAYAGLLRIMTPHWRRYLWLALPALPLSAAVNLLVKRPIGKGVAAWAGVSTDPLGSAPHWFLLFLLLLAPVTEEAIKVAPLLLPRARALLGGRDGALWTGFTLGVGFGIGEAAYIGYGIAQSPEFAGIPWYLFTGYSSERFAVCFGHGVMTAVVVTGLGRGRPLLGYAGAVLLHTAVNTGAMAYQVGWVPAWGATLSLGAGLVLLALIFERLRRQALQEARPVGHVEHAEHAAGEVVLFRRNRVGDE